MDASTFDPDAAARFVGAVLSRMPAAHVRAFAAAIKSAPAPAVARHHAMTALAAPGYRDHAAGLLTAWEHLPGLDGAAFGALLSTALAVRDAERQAQLVEIVATGPATPHVSVRQTRAVLLELISTSSSDLLLVSFAAYKVSELVEALDLAAGRGVTIRLVLETSDDSTGVLTIDAARAFDGLEKRVQLYVWPADQRPAGVPSLLHAKAVVADARLAFISSANLTGSGLEHNLELGVLIRGGPVPSRISEHFRALIARGVLQRV